MFLYNKFNCISGAIYLSLRLAYIYRTTWCLYNLGHKLIPTILRLLFMNWNILFAFTRIREDFAPRHKLTEVSFFIIYGSVL